MYTVLRHFKELITLKSSDLEVYEKKFNFLKEDIYTL